jgi:hypothetical protein
MLRWRDESDMRLLTVKMSRRSPMWAALIAAMTCPLANSSAEMPPRIACVADDTFWIWYREGIRASPPGLRPEPGQKLVGSRLLAPEGRFRLEGGELYFVDGFQKEYRYGPVQETSPGRLSAGDFTIIFDVDFQSAVSVRVDRFDTRVESFKCLPG